MKKYKKSDKPAEEINCYMKYEAIIKKIISDNVKLTKSIDSVNPHDKLENAGMDSISFICVIVEIENYFDIEFPDEKLILEETGTIKQICEIVESMEV